MKEFDLEKALSGAPVRLRDGQKAIIYYRIPDHIRYHKDEPVMRPLKGMVFEEDGYLSNCNMEWDIDGKQSLVEGECSGLDIVGMYDDMEEVLDKIVQSATFVELRNGRKAVVLPLAKDVCIFDDGDKLGFILRGAILPNVEDDTTTFSTASWKADGSYSNVESPYDIIGLWKD